MTPVLAALPAPTGALIGRDRDIDVAPKLLLNPDVRLLTLTGTGGAGKTSLALAVARDAAPAYSSVRFVPLASLTDPTQVVGAIGRALDVPETTGTPLVAALMLALRGRSHLLVLDNFEHLSDSAPVVAELLACAPDLTVLATSRAPLQLSCERLLEVSTLALPGKGPTPVARLGEVAAVRLFVERARDRPASGRCAIRSRGATTCCVSRNGCSSAGWPCSPAAARWRRWRRSVPTPHRRREGGLTNLLSTGSDASRR